MGPYEIVRPIGAGGMGEVYQARDTRLDRVVAVKVSREQFSARFEREARAIAQLNPPHVCQVYETAKALDDGFLMLPNMLVFPYERLVSQSSAWPGLKRRLNLPENV